MQTQQSSAPSNESFECAGALEPKRPQVRHLRGEAVNLNEVGRRHAHRPRRPIIGSRCGGKTVVFADEQKRKVMDPYLVQTFERTDRD